MMMMMMINFINVSRPHSLGKSHTNLGTQLIDIKTNLFKTMKRCINTVLFTTGFVGY